MSTALEAAPRLRPWKLERVPHERLSWAAGLSFQVPESLGEPLSAEPKALAEAARALRERAAFTDQKPTSSKLPIHYHNVPSALRMLAARALGGFQRRRQSRWASFPSWPLDLSSDFLADLAGLETPRFAEGPTPVVLSHDLDSPEGLENLVTFFLDMEEKAGARSTSFVVPCAWPLDHGRLAAVKERGHELGIHGYDHRNRTPYCSDDERRARVLGARELKERYGAVGYRAPSLCRTRPLLQELARLPYAYDASIPTSGGPFPVPNNGCASARPFRVEGIWELPLSLPRDGSLRFLGHSPGEIAMLWIRCAEQIARSRGVVVLLAHCEERFSGGAEMRAAYRAFLDHVADHPERFRFQTAREVMSRVAGLPSPTSSAS